MSPLPPLGVFSHAAAIPLGDYQAIMTATVDSGGASSITFSSIPSTYKHLQIRGIGRDNNAGSFLTGLYFQFNGDTGSNYSWHRVWGDGASPFAQGSATQTAALAGVFTGNQYTAGSYGAGVIDILDYTNTSKYKTIRGLSGGDLNINTAGYVGLHSSNWMNTAAISSMTISPAPGQSWLQYSSFALYGVK